MMGDERQPATAEAELAAKSSPERKQTVETESLEKAAGQLASAASSAAADQEENGKQLPAAETAEKETSDAGNNLSDQQNIDVECERLLRNAQRQVKQMMAEAVARKFIHEESSSIISLCVAVDACLSHGLRRRALGLFKTNSSTALIQKVAKSCKSAQDVLELVSAQEKQLEQNKKLSNQHQQQQLQQQQQQQQPEQSPTRATLRATIGRQASNSNVHKRNLWIKCALIDKKLVDIVEHLAANSSSYYEPEALISNYLCSQILSSLLSGLNAIEFSRSKTNDYHQFDDPSADELLKRHKLANPIACLCTQRKQLPAPLAIPGPNHNSLSRSVTESAKQVSNQAVTSKRLTASQNSLDQASSKRLSSSPGTSSLRLQPSPAKRTVSAERQEQRAATCKSRSNSEQSSAARSAGPSVQRRSPSPGASQQASKQQQSMLVAKSAAETGVLARRRPLALKTSIARGTLVTDCHHYSCQEISEHQKTKGYSFLCGNSNGGATSFNSAISSGQQQHSSNHHQQQQQQQQQYQSQQQDLSLWSPRMLHETLHQNSRSCLLYAKNNVLLETQPNETMAGYLSLHQTSSDLILKWIPNQMINGSQLSTQNACAEFPPSSGQQANERPESPAVNDRQESSHNGHQQRCAPAESASQAGGGGGGGEQGAPIAVESSYLDYVTILSVSRIVLLHCQFGGQQPAASAPAAAAAEHDSPGHDLATANGAHSAEANLQTANESSRNTADSATVAIQSGPVETLILVEADGIQRAPFKFPKGGLRLFLSCLESGLHPSRYLDPAIKFDDDDDWSDPLKSPPPIAATTTTTSGDGDSSASGGGGGLIFKHTSAYLLTERPGSGKNSSSSLGLDSPSAASEPASSASRLDIILKRLPSLKRRAQASKLNSEPATPTDSSADQQQRQRPLDHLTNNNNNNDDDDDDKDSAESRSSTPQQQPAAVAAATCNYVYRIVSFQQPDWPLQTPPHSALSVGSSSSGSFGLASNQLQQQQQQQQQQRNQHALASAPGQRHSASQSSMQKFRWSLGKLAMFSARYTNSAGSTSSSVSNGGLLQTQTTSNTNENDSLFDNSSLCRTISESADGEQSLTKTTDGDSNSIKLARIDAKLNDLKLSTSDDILALRTQSIQTLCESMRRQIVARAFYGWLAHCRRMRIIRTHLIRLINDDEAQCCLISELEEPELYEESKFGLTREKWGRLMECSGEWTESDLCRETNRLVYYGGVESDELRKEVWPYLLGHYKFKDSVSERKARDESVRAAYKACGKDWIKIERTVKQRDNEILAANIAKASSRLKKQQQALAANVLLEADGEAAKNGINGGGDDDNDEGDDDDVCADERDGEGEKSIPSEGQQLEAADGDANGGEGEGYPDAKSDSVDPELADESKPLRKLEKVDSQLGGSKGARQPARAGSRRRRRARLESTGSVGSDASITDQFGNNVHRIDKDVQRCDRNFWYFKDTDNLEKLRNIMCSYVWQHLDVGYVQGMCDIAAPFLVIFDDEVMAFSCFSKLMERMVSNFPHGCAMDQHFESLKYLMQVLDPKLFDVLQRNGDYADFYFCYRWLLLDFKRELAYEDVYRVWETIWSARHVVSGHFVIFMALAMVRYYRDIIIENNMDFTDTIKFFNEMAERHDARRITALARDCIVELQNYIRS